MINNNEKTFKEEVGEEKAFYISKDPQALSQFFKEEGNRFYLKREFDVALIYFTKAVEYDPENKIYYSNRAACHLAKGNYRSAVKDALKSVEKDSTYSKGYFRGALAYYEMNLLDKALELIKTYKDSGKEDDLQSVTNLEANIISKQKEHDRLNSLFPSFANFQKFENWLYDGDVYFSKLELKFFSDSHRGVVAKNDIEKDEIILKVPKERLISIELAKTTKIGEKIASFMWVELNSPKHCLLSSFLLCEMSKGDESDWKIYLEILPKDYSSFPIFYSEEEMLFLQGSPFKVLVEEKKTDIYNDYEKICGYVPEFALFDFKTFCEVRMAVSSRIFGVKIDYKKTDVLSPFADLLNHKRPRTTHWYYDEKYKAFIIQALEDISKLSEVYDSYGKKCNSRFLLNYGFIIEDNDANEFPVTLKLDESCPLFDQKKSFFTKENEMVKKFKISENIIDYAVVDFFSFLRFLTYEGEMDILCKMISDNQKIVFEDIVPSFYLISPISEECEIKVLETIESLASSYLKNYPTTLDEDLCSLQMNNKQEYLSNNQRNCILMRVSEKKILQFFVNFARECIELFKLGEEEIREKYTQEYNIDDCPYDFYIHEVILKFKTMKK